MNTATRLAPVTPGKEYYVQCRLPSPDDLLSAQRWEDCWTGQAGAIPPGSTFAVATKWRDDLSKMYPDEEYRVVCVGVAAQPVLLPVEFAPSDNKLAHAIIVMGLLTMTAFGVFLAHL